jgi:hypothetical protein
MNARGTTTEKREKGNILFNINTYIYTSIRRHVPTTFKFWIALNTNFNLIFGYYFHITMLNITKINNTFAV